jgi:hypothetical protein
MEDRALPIRLTINRHVVQAVLSLVTVSTASARLAQAGGCVEKCL